MANPRMTLEDVLEDMRSKNMKMDKRTLSHCLREGIFPFATILNTGPTGRTSFLIMRKDYEAWANEYLGG